LSLKFNFQNFKYKSPGSDRISAQLIQLGGEILRVEIHELIKSIWNKEELPDQWKEPIIYCSIGETIRIDAVIIVLYHYLHSTTFYEISLSEG
jgi:hypothetical protein